MARMAMYTLLGWTFCALNFVQAQEGNLKLLQGRDGFPYFSEKLAQGKEVRIAYLGGSITAAADGWRGRTLSWFQQQYPQAKISEINAAIGGTGSDLGVFRCGQDVLRHKPDLVFIEFAVNDGGADPRQIIRCMEGIVRQIWQADLQTDICFVYTLHTNMCPDYEKNQLPRSVATMEKVASHYQIPAIHVGQKIVELAASKQLAYRPEEAAALGPAAIAFSTDECHPLPAAHQVYCDVITAAFQEMKAAASTTRKRLLPPLDSENLEQAKLVPIPAPCLSGSWRKLDSKVELARSFGRYLPEIWEGRMSGDKLTFRFKGTAVKLYDIVGPDGGQVVCTVDGKSGQPQPRFDSYCTYNRLSALTVAENLPDVEHTVCIELHPDQPNRTSVTDKERLKPNFDPQKYEGTVLRLGYLMLVGDLLE